MFESLDRSKKKVHFSLLIREDIFDIINVNWTRLTRHFETLHKSIYISSPPGDRLVTPLEPPFHPSFANLAIITVVVRSRCCLPAPPSQPTGEKARVASWSLRDRSWVEFRGRILKFAH